MRKLILIAAISLLATQAHAGGPRSLSLAATNSSQQATEPAAPVTPQAPAASPATNVQTATTAPASTPPVTTAPSAIAPAATPIQAASATETVKPKHRRPSTEARVIRELHRHGIYW